MAVFTAAQLASLMKGKLNTIDFTSSAIENDTLLLKMSEALVVAFSDNNIFADPASNGGVGTSNISLIEPTVTVGWNPEPTGTYSAVSFTEPASTRFTVDTIGGWKVSGFGLDVIPNSNGRWRVATDPNTTNYEISITKTGTSVSSIGGADLSGVWTTISGTMGVSISDTSGLGKSSNITAQIREKFNPSNITTVASFTIEADGEEPL
jgi:hypothetical protein